MARVTLLTQWARYEGDLDLALPGGQTLRFLDVLNFPSRLQQGRAMPSVVLRDAVRRDDLSAQAASCGEITLRAGGVIAGWELTAETRSEAHIQAVSAYEQRRHAGSSSRVFLYLDNGYRVEATVGGGLTTLDSIKPGRDFVACSDVLLTDPRRPGAAPWQVAFLAVNVRRLEAIGVLGQAAATP